MTPESPELPPPLSEPAPPRLNWLPIVGLLLTPAVISFLAAMATLDGLAVVSAAFGSLIAGIVTGALLAQRMHVAPAVKVLLGIAFAILLATFSLGLSFTGCLVGGFSVDFR